MTHLLTLPIEVLSIIFRGVDAEDWDSARRTCRTLKHQIDEDDLLYKAYYLKKLDNSDAIKHLPARQWRQRTRRFMQFEHVMEFGTTRKEKDLTIGTSDVIALVVFELVDNASRTDDSKNLDLLRWYFRRPRDDRGAILWESPLMNQARGAFRVNAVSQDHGAKLHCYRGVKVAFSNWDACYPFACSRVYDFSNYSQENLWGPFKSDGSHHVEWDMLESIMIIVFHNLAASRIYDNPYVKRTWCTSFYGLTNLNYQIGRRLDLTRDPYGVEGTWMRIISIVDLPRLFEYNAIPVRDGVRRPWEGNETIRMALIRLHVTSIEAPTPDMHQDMPVVHFEGTSQPVFAHSDPNAPGYSKIRGYVRTTTEREVWWTTLTAFRGEERWKSEGIQIGGLQAARGIWGTWFDKDYKRDGPIGPTALWKLSDSQDLTISQIEKATRI